MIKYPNYDRSILSIASSVLNHFGVKDCQHKTLPEFDKLLEKDYKNIIVILFDVTQPSKQIFISCIWIKILRTGITPCPRFIF